MAPEQKLRSIRRASGWAEARMRLARVIVALPTSLVIALAASAVVLGARKLLAEHLPDSWAVAALAGAAGSVVLTVLFQLLRRLPPRAGVLALDAAHDTRGRLTNALAFEDTPAEQRSPMMGAAIADACEALPKLSARRAVRVPVPPELAVSLVLALAVYGLARLTLPPELPEPVELAKVDKLDALEMNPDDLELFKDAADALAHENQSPDVKAAIERFNQLIEDIADRRISRLDAFRRMREIESQLLKGADEDQKALEEALKDTASELKKSELAKPIADAMEKTDLKKAEQETRELAKTLRGEGKTKPNKAELERLRQAMMKAAARRKEIQEALNQERAKLREELLAMKNEPKPEQPEKKKEQEDLLKKKKRELERLDREAERKERAARQLSRLDRELAKAAEDLLREMGASAEDLERMAEDLNRMEQQQMSDKEKEELRKRLEELRELIRQQGQSGKKQLKRLQRFSQKARGGQGSGQPQPGDGSSPGDMMRNRPGGGQDGKQPGGMGGVELGKGPGGQGNIPMPGSGQGQGQDQPGGEPGKGVGSSRGGPIAGDPTKNPGMGTIDVRAEAADGKGPSNSQVILSAADRGFTGKPYSNVYKKYQTVAEDQINNEKIPDGYRFYVRRYFQLIRPRE